MGLKSVGLGDPRHLQLEWFVLALVMQLVEAGGRGEEGREGQEWIYMRVKRTGSARPVR